MPEPGDGPDGGPTEKDTGRLEAFSDGVMAVIITIMAFELRVPASGSFTALRHRLPELLIYVLSFAFVGIYWNNHHHLLRAARRVSASVMWTNLLLLFFLSLIPVATEWIGDSYRDTAPATTYSAIALATALAYTGLVAAIVRTEGRSFAVAAAIGNDRKGRVSIAAYVVSMGLSFFSPWFSYALLTAAALIWFVPDRRLERSGDS